jgi:hypothetical protein
MTEPYVPSSPHPDGPFPQDFGRYRLDERLGGGTQGTVFRAFDTSLRAPVALKVPAEGVRRSPDLLARFYQEGRAAARLRQVRNVCQVLDVGEWYGIPYLTMQLVVGKPPAVGCQWDQQDAARLVWKLAVALHAAHLEGVVHRDLKPSNVLIDGSGEPTLTDFGVALLLGESRLTDDGTVLGSWHYMAPEQMAGDPAQSGPACDIYGLGVVLYELLLGRVPFAGGNRARLFEMVIEWPPPPPRLLRPDLDARLESLCLKALEKHPGDRFPHMRAFADALAAYLGEPPLPEPAPADAAPAPAVAEDAIRFVFCGPGETAPPRVRPGFLYLDVGNGLRAGVIDHHHLRDADTCTACLVTQYVNLVDAALPIDRRAGDRFTIVLHEHPDLDAVPSSYLVVRRLTTGDFPPAAAELVDHVARIDEGSLGFTQEQPFALYAAFQQVAANLHQRGWDSKAEQWQTLVYAGMGLIHFVLAEATRRGVPIQQVDAFACPGMFTADDRAAISGDLARYERKLAIPSCRARRARLTLPAPGGARPVPALLVRDVQNPSDTERCRFFKDWARSDARRGGEGPGFVGLCVFHGEGAGQARRCILSVTPDSGVSLCGLGELLDAAEGRKREAVYGVDDRVEDPATGASKPPRPGYANSDPWYDGRGHKFTIVDSPRSGTVLTAGEIERLFLTFGGCTTPPEALGD